MKKMFFFKHFKINKIPLIYLKVWCLRRLNKIIILLRKTFKSRIFLCKNQGNLKNNFFK